MSFIRWVQASYLRSTIALTLIYLFACLTGVVAIKSHAPNAVPIASVAMGVPLLLTGFFIRSGYPRWSLVAAASILAVGTPLAAIVANDPAAWLKSPLGAMGYNWLYLWTVAGTPATSSRCSPPFVVITGSLILVAASWIAMRF